MRDILTDAAFSNAMVVHAAFGGSTNLLLHVPAIAHAAGLRRPTVEDWARVNRQVPRLVDALPNGPRQSSDRAGVPRRRRSGSDAASAARSGCSTLASLHGEGDDARRAARMRGRRPSAARAARNCCASATASIPTT